MTPPSAPGSIWMRVLLVLCAAKVAALIVAFDPSGLIAFDLPKSLVSRAFLWPMAAVLAVLFAERGWGLVPRSRLHVAVAGVGVSWIVAAGTAEDRFLALFGEDDRYLGLTYLADMAVLYVACAVAVRTARDAAALFTAIAAAAVVALGYAAVQAVGADPFWWQTAPAERPFSTFGNPDHFGHFLSVLFGLALGGFVGSAGLTGALVGALGVGLSLAAASLVATRGTAIGIAASALAAPIASASPARAAVAVVGVSLALAAVITATPLGDRLRATLEGVGVDDRATVYATSLDAFAARPVSGYGPDNFRFAYTQHRPSPGRVPPAETGQTSAHNWLLDAAVMTGTVGLVALLALVTLGTFELIAAARRLPNVGGPLLLAWCAYWAHALVAVGAIAIGWVPWLALGVATGLDRHASVEPLRRVGHWVYLLAFVAALVVSATGARAFLANRDALVMEHASATGDSTTALVAAENAVARDPNRADNWNRLGIALDAFERWDASLAAYREAAARRPHEPIYWANVARSYARLAMGGDVAARDSAIAAARKAVESDRSSYEGHVVLLEIAVAFGMCDLARTEARELSELGRTDLGAPAGTCR